MSKRHSFWALAVILLALGAASGQDDAGQPAGAVPPASPQQPVPAYGQENPVPSISENPPISGLDLPNLEPHGAPLSYLQPGAHLSEAGSSNLQNSLGGSGWGSITNALGSLELQRLWSHYDLALDYLGGVGYYSVNGIGFKQIEELGMNQKITWKRGELGLRDAFSYQPEGTFGGAYGSVATLGAGLSGQSTFFNGMGLGALGQVPRIMNLALGDVVENLTPKSSVTATGGYGFVHFLGNEPVTGNSFIGNTQITGQVGYDRLLGLHDQGALVYGYQGYTFSTGVAFHSNVIQLMWGHRISGRMDFLIGAGPQFTQLYNIPTYVANPTMANTIPPCALEPTEQNPFGETCPENDLRISAAGRGSLRYRFPNVSLDFRYEHFISSGSGFFAGAESDIATLSASRPLNRIWSITSDIGYSHNDRVTPITCSSTAPNCPGVSANTYQYGFVGLSVHRMFGRDFHAFASYQFNDLAFDNSYCVSATPGPCSRIGTRNVGTIGLDWKPRPMRFD